MKLTNNPQRVFVIAEAGVNHNGRVEMALRLVDAAKEAEADAVKFQTFMSANLVSQFAPKADYQKRNTDSRESQLAMLRKLELSVSDHIKLIKHCEEVGIKFMSSPFDHESLDLLVNQFDLPILKLGSGELTNAPLLLSLAQTGKPLILSTGMATLGEVEEALSVLAFGYMGLGGPNIEKFRKAFSSSEGQGFLKEKVILLHCTTEYPAPFLDVNLRAMDTLADSFGLPVGYSDHTEGWIMPIAAVARGAKVIEKHFTLDKLLPGPDHKASLEPEELKVMIASIRKIEECFGDGKKKPALSEIQNMDIARKSLVAAKMIRMGECFTEDNLTVKRPGTGISPMNYWDHIGRQSEKDYAADEVIS